MLDKKDRLILANQYRILVALDAEDRETYERWIEALEEGFESAYMSIFDHIDDGLPRERCKFVIDVLCMYDALQRSFKNLTDTTGIDPSDVVFRGFDGNEEGAERSYAQYVRDREGRFDYLDVDSDDLNAHMPSIDLYQRMLPAWL